jgi:hypothetical protein
MWWIGSPKTMKPLKVPGGVFKEHADASINCGFNARQVVGFRARRRRRRRSSSSSSYAAVQGAEEWSATPF